MASTARKITLKSSDGAAFEVEEAVVALHSQTIKDMINAHSGIVALSDVTGNILAKVIQYCNKHSSGSENELRQWDADFVKVDRDTLFDLLNVS
uniref:SKP1 component POZ domain-containing protein n=1 Tax=Lotus japonicus TaxID=34305 RepID=I3SES0_LOTJA|nr:unknown [Lotus japonicus]